MIHTAVTEQMILLSEAEQRSAKHLRQTALHSHKQLTAKQPRRSPGWKADLNLQSSLLPDRSSAMRHDMNPYCPSVRRPFMNSVDVYMHLKFKKYRLRLSHFQQHKYGIHTPTRRIDQAGES